MKAKRKIVRRKAASRRDNKGGVKPETWNLRLYIAGQTAKSIAALSNLKRICDAQLDGHYQVEVIDLMKHPELARGDQIVAIPTLVRKIPEPMKRLIGDLSSAEKVMMSLEMYKA